jgi:hypothetical protein
MLAAVRERRPKCVDPLGGPRNILTAPSRARLRALSQIVRCARAPRECCSACDARGDTPAVYLTRRSHRSRLRLGFASFMTSKLGGREDASQSHEDDQLGLFVVGHHCGVTVTRAGSLPTRNCRHAAPPSGQEIAAQPECNRISKPTRPPSEGVICTSNDSE